MSLSKIFPFFYVSSYPETNVVRNVIKLILKRESSAGEPGRCCTFRVPPQDQYTSKCQKSSSLNSIILIGSSTIFVLFHYCYLAKSSTEILTIIGVLKIIVLFVLLQRKVFFLTFVFFHRTCHVCSFDFLFELLDWQSF